MHCHKCKKEIIDESVFCMYCGVSVAEQNKPPRKPRTRGNGMGSVYKLPNGKYRAAITLGYDKKGKRIYKTKSGFRTKKEALEYIPILKNNPKITKKPKFHEVYNEWSERHYETITKNKTYNYINAYKRCEPLWYLKLEDIRAKDMQKVIDDTVGGYYPKQGIRMLCNQIYKYGIENDYIDKNYTQYLKLPPIPKSTRRAFNKTEIKQLWMDYDIGNEFTGYILIMIYTGMRLGELKKLRNENINLSEDYMIGGIKTDAGIDRQIVISKKIKPIIERFYSDNNLFMNIPDKKFQCQFRETMKRLNIEGVTPHCCRHTFATLMAEVGIQPAIIKDIAGHENYQTTLQYTHISLTEKLNAVNQI